MQAGISDLTSWFNEELLYEAVADQAAKSKIAMETGNIFFGGLNDIDYEIFESSVTHYDTPKGITAEKLRKVWRVSNEVAQQTMDVTTQLDNQDADSTLSHSSSTNDCMLR